MAKSTRTRGRRAGRYSTGQSRILDDALSLASTLADGRKRAGADKISELAEATRGFGSTLDDFPQLRGYSDTAADNLDDLADYIARTDLPDMLEDFTGFAKRQPIATLTLGVAAGLAMTQLMRNTLPMRARGKSNGQSARRRKRARKAVN